MAKMRNNLSATTQEFRTSLKTILRRLKISQKQLSEHICEGYGGESQITQPWLSQLLSGSRKAVDKEMLTRVKLSLTEIVNLTCEKGEIENYLQEIEKIFFPLLGNIATVTTVNSPKYQAETVTLAAAICKILPTNISIEILCLTVRILNFTFGMGHTHTDQGYLFSADLAKAMTIASEVQTSVSSLIEDKKKLCEALNFLEKFICS